MTRLLSWIARILSAPLLRWEVRDGIHLGHGSTVTVTVRPSTTLDPFTHAIEMTAHDGRSWRWDVRCSIEDARDTAETMARRQLSEDTTGADAIRRAA